MFEWVPAFAVMGMFVCLLGIFAYDYLVNDEPQT